MTGKKELKLALVARRLDMLQDDSSQPMKKRVASTRGSKIAKSKVQRKPRVCGDTLFQMTKSFKKGQKGAKHEKKLKLQISSSNDKEEEVPLRKRRKLSKKIPDEKSFFTFKPSMFHHVDYRSSPKPVVDFMSSLTDNQIRDIYAIGFGSLIGMRMREVNRRLYYLLTAYYDSMVMKIYDGSTIHVGSEFFYETLAVPCKGRPIYGCGSAICSGLPVIDSDESGLAEKQNQLVYKLTNELNLQLNRTYMRVDRFVDAMRNMPDGGDDFKRLFVLFVVSSFLAPNAEKSLVLEIAHTLDDVSKISQYDWCSFIAVTIDTYVKKLKQKIMKKYNSIGTESSERAGRRFDYKVGGCFPALLVGYFHKYVFGENPPNSIPYIHHWNDGSIKERVAKEVDHPYVGTARVSIFNNELQGGIVHVVKEHSGEDFSYQRNNSKEFASTRNDDSIEFVIPNHFPSLSDLSKIAKDKLHEEFLLHSRNLLAICENGRTKFEEMIEKEIGTPSGSKGDNNQFVTFMKDVSKALDTAFKSLVNYRSVPYFTATTKFIDADSKLDNVEEANVNDDAAAAATYLDEFSTFRDDVVPHVDVSNGAGEDVGPRLDDSSRSSDNVAPPHQDSTPSGETVMPGSLPFGETVSEVTSN